MPGNAKRSAGYEHGLTRRLPGNDASARAAPGHLRGFRATHADGGPSTVVFRIDRHVIFVVVAPIQSISIRKPATKESKP